MRTLFLSSFQNFISKNILNTDVLRILRDERQARIVIFVPIHKADYFRRHYASQNVIIEGIDVERIKKSRRNILVNRILFMMIDSHYTWYKNVERRDANPTAWAWIKYWVYGALVKLLSGSKALNRVARFLYRTCSASGFYAAHFERYRPDLVFSTDVFDPFDAQLLKEARQRGVPTLGMVRSWDNCWSKGVMAVFPDRLLTNNAIIKEEAVRLHDYPPERVTVVGLPQFDAFVNEQRMTRAEFFASIGVDPSKRLVVFAPAGTILSDTDGQLCDILEHARASGAFAKPVHFFVRNHPGHPADLSKFKSVAGFTVQDPGHVFGKNPKDTELAPDDQKFLADLLYHSDVIMYVATSLGLDAAVYDKPVIMTSFDGYEKKEYTKSVMKYLDEDHMKKLLATGGIRVAKSAEEMISALAAYLENPSSDREGRKRIVEEQLYRIDGKSGERVAAEIKASLKPVSVSPAAVA